MAFKFVAVFCLIAVAAAGDYEYNKPTANNNNSPSSNSDNNNKGPVANTGTDLENNNNVQDSYSAPSQQMADTYQQQDNTNDNTSYDDATSYHSSADDSYNVNTYQAPAAAAAGYDYTPQAYYPPAKYDYSYSVNDPTTGDIKSHSETRDGYYVRGAYSLVDPDGYKRTVTYTADNVNGFNAVVNREPIAVQYSVPAVKYQAAPVAVQPQPFAKVHQDVQQSSAVPSQAQDSYASPPAHDGKGPYA